MWIVIRVTCGVSSASVSWSDWSCTSSRKPDRVGSSTRARYSCAEPTSSYRFSIRPRASIVRSASYASIVPDRSSTASDELVDLELLRGTT